MALQPNNIIGPHKLNTLEQNKNGLLPSDYLTTGNCFFPMTNKRESMKYNKN